VVIRVLGRQVEVDESVHAHIARRIDFSLGRLSPHILRVTVTIVDINGPRGGEDKACRIEVRLRAAGSVFAEDADASLYAAIDQAVGSVARSVARAVNRLHDRERGTRRRSRAVPAIASPGAGDQSAA
jgi:ribosomal subunit interface protein